MRYKPEQKEETRRRMLEAAGRGFRANGFSGIGVDGIAKAAGATSGAFYAHFGSKDDAFAAALDRGLDQVIEAFAEFQRVDRVNWVDALADYYLSRTHRDDLPSGCAMTSLSPEVVRAGAAIHAAYEAKMVRIADLVADGLEGGTPEDRRARAWALIAMLVGGLTVARAVESEDLADGIAAAVREAAMRVAGTPGSRT